MYVNLTPVNSLTYGTKNQTTSAGNASTHSRCCSAFVLATRGLFHLACRDRKSRWRHAWCNLLAFQNKSDLFSEIWELAKPNIDELESEYQAKFPDDPLSVLREILVYVLEATVTEERRRLLMEIIFHKCEFVGEIASVQLAQRSLCLENYDRIEQTLRNCMNAKMLPENLNTRRVAVLLRSYLSGILENWLFAPESFDLKKTRVNMSLCCWKCVCCALRFACLRPADQVSLREFSPTFSPLLFCPSQP